MSDYPPGSYGLPPYGKPDQNQYLPPGYPNQYYHQGDSRAGQMPMASSYDMSMTAYGYNNTIPSFNTPALAPGVSPFPTFHGWHKDAFPPAPYNPSLQNPQYPNYGSGPHHAIPPQTPYYTPFAQPVQQEYHSPAQPIQHQVRELSEGEFEDTTVPPNATPGTYHTSHYRGHQGHDGSEFVDTAHRAIYAKSHEDSPQQGASSGNGFNYNQPPHSRWPPSISKSPYASPGMADHSEILKGNQQKSQPPTTSAKTNSPSQTQVSNRTPNNASDSTLQPRVNGIQKSQNTQKPHEDEALKPQSASRKPLRTHPYGPVAEAKKKAEGAVLNLWSYDVRFPEYIQAGFEPPLVEKLFDGLKLSKTPLKAINGVSIEPTSENRSVEKTGKSQAPIVAQPSTFNQEVSKDGLSTQSVDKVAQSSSMPSASEGSSSASPKQPTEFPQPKSAAVTEKERTLQLKMEALRKSREERAQKAAAKNSAKPIASATSTVLKENIKPETTEKPSSTSSPSEDKSEASQNPTKAPSSEIVVPVADTQKSAPAIPGLFLTSTTSNPSLPAPTSTMPGPTQTHPRKRPVASDFDTPITSTSSKRLFGHSRSDQPLMIDISEDEVDSEEDVAMDLDSPADTMSPMYSMRKTSEPRPAQPVHSLLDAPRKPFTPPPAALNTPPITQSTNKSVYGTLENLQRKETEIEKMKRKIAEMEQRKKGKINRPGSSGVQTPRPSETNGFADAAISNNKVSSSIQTPRASNARDRIALDKELLAKAQAEEEKAAELRRQEAEKRTMRREQIAAAITGVDADVQQRQRELDELREEVARVEATLKKKLGHREMLANEMEKLGRETDDQLQLQKNKLQDLADQEMKSSEAPNQSTSLDGSELQTAETSLPPVQNMPKSPSNPREPDHPITGVAPITLEQQSNQVHTNNVVDEGTAQVDRPDEVSEQSMIENNDEAPSNQNLEAALEEAVRAEAEAHEEKDVDMEDTHNADPTQMPKANASSPEEGEASPSEDEAANSPDYSPVLDRTIPENHGIESDNYEPPEASPPADMAVDSPPFSPAPPEEARFDDGSRELTELSRTVGTMEQDAEESTLFSQSSTVPAQVEVRPAEVSNKPQRFTPYESPLNKFHAFRFHPEYKKMVTGGLKSITYAHKIDPNKELCRFETGGGICNDKTCDLQHYRDMKLPDDEILGVLGSPDEFTGEQRERFVLSLKGLLGNLRSRSIRDFDTIAGEIIAHRANFLGDKSKILMLEGTTI